MCAAGNEKAPRPPAGDHPTAVLGWAPVHDVPPALAETVTRAEVAIVAFQRDSDLKALAEAVAAWDRILEDARFAAAPRTFHLDALNRAGVAHWFYGERYQRNDELALAESYIGQALKLAPDGWPDTWRYLNNLGGVAVNRYARSGILADLDAAIDHIEAALAAVRPDEPGRALVHYNLAVDLGFRYQRLGALDDLEAAAVHGRAAADLFPPDSMLRATALDHLGTTYRERYLRTREPDDLQMSVQLLEEALGMTRPGDRRLAATLTNLGNALLEMYHLNGDPEVLDLATQAHSDSVENTPRGDAALASRLNNLGNSLTQRYRLTGQVSDLKKVVKLYRQAVKLTPRTDALLPTRLYNLANSLQDLQDRSRGERYLREATGLYREACQTGLDYSLEWVLNASLVWGGWAAYRRAWAEASEAYGYGLTATERLYRRQVLEKDKTTWLAAARGLVGRAAYALARLGRSAEAVAVLEQGRTRSLSEALTRQEIALEAASAQDRAAFRAALERIANLEAEVSLAGRPGTRDMVSITAELRQAHEALQTTVDRIRTYVLPEIVALADALDQPLVYLVTTQHGSLALTVPPSRQAGTDAVTAVWLDGFDGPALDDILYDQDDKQRYLHGTVLASLDLLSSLLDGIWPALEQGLLAELIGHLSALDCAQAVLIPTGTLALLPLAAVALDRVTFRTIPSARALHTVLHDEDHVDVPPALLAIGNPSSRGRQPLAFARLEVETAAALFQQQAYQAATYYEGTATLEQLAAHLPGTTHLHFSCHGQFDMDNPLDSALYLAGDQALTLQGLLGGTLDVSAARLAVLSACQTGIIDFQNVPDEAVGFQAGFLQAGVPGVVSTLWPVNDLSTALLTAEFYRRHLAEGQEPAEALRGAQLWLREATAEEMKLSERYEELYRASGRQDVGALRWMRFYRANPQNRPFAHPYYWAGFVFSGV
jgi:CHAT domain-containing protein/tetratricopeptide (TPR) repeat protein